MTSGTPDYFNTVRQNYGAAKQATGAFAAVANDITSLISVVGKGTIYGGSLFLDYTDDQSLSAPRLIIDNEEVGVIDFETINSKGLSKEGCYPFYGLIYDMVNFKYTVGITGGYTFDVMFKIQFEEKHGGTPAVKSYLTYALLT